LTRIANSFASVGAEYEFYRPKLAIS